MKKFKTFLPFLLILTLIFPIKSETTPFDTLNIINDVTLMVRHDEQKVVIDNDTILSVYETINTNLAFALDEEVSYRGKVSSFTLPDIFRVETETQKFDLIYEDIVIATVVRDANSLEVRIEFKHVEYLDNHSNIKRTLKFYARFDKTHIETEKKYPIEFGTLAEWIVTITPLGPGERSTMTYVWGHERNTVENQIYWVIYISAFTDLTDVRLTDEHSKGQEIIESSFSIDVAESFDSNNKATRFVSINLTPTLTTWIQS